jgi:hypothetical protein
MADAARCVFETQADSVMTLVASVVLLVAVVELLALVDSEIDEENRPPTDVEPPPRRTIIR